jgi:hypothetical protein
MTQSCVSGADIEINAIAESKIAILVLQQSGRQGSSEGLDTVGVRISATIIPLSGFFHRKVAVCGRPKESGQRWIPFEGRIQQSFGVGYDSTTWLDLQRASGRAIEFTTQFNAVSNPPATK